MERNLYVLLWHFQLQDYFRIALGAEFSCFVIVQGLLIDSFGQAFNNVSEVLLRSDFDRFRCVISF